MPTSDGHMTQHRPSCFGGDSVLEASLGVVETSYGCLNLVAHQLHDRMEHAELGTSKNQRVRKSLEPSEDCVELPM